MRTQQTTVEEADVKVFAAPEFQPRRWMMNGHVQTIVGNLLRRPDDLPTPMAELVEVSPATSTHIASQVLCHCHWQPEAVRGERLTVIVLHGLEGSSQSQYVVGNANKMWRAGLNVVRMNMRNCGGTEALSATLYHSGLSADVLAVLVALERRFGLRQFALVGYSMGGNLVLKLAGELGAGTHRLPAGVELCGVAGVSPAIDLAQSADALHLPMNRLYEQRFLTALLKRFRRKAMLFPHVFDPGRAERIYSLRDFDEKITSLYNGFRGADDYYERAACARVLDRIATPTLILHALDDPFIRLSAETRAMMGENPQITLLETEHGGHCAFLAKAGPDDDGYWAETTLLSFLLAQCGCTAAGERRVPAIGGLVR